MQSHGGPGMKPMAVEKKGRVAHPMKLTRNIGRAMQEP